MSQATISDDDSACSNKFPFSSHVRWERICLFTQAVAVGALRRISYHIRPARKQVCEGWTAICDEGTNSTMRELYGTRPAPEGLPNIDTQGMLVAVCVDQADKRLPCYEALGLAPYATEAEIGCAYRKLSLCVHPDEVGGSSEKFLGSSHRSL